MRRRAELLYQQLDGLQTLRRTLRPELLAESRKHKAAKLLRQIPCIGPIRAARLIALMQTPHRFRSKRQLWTYSGLGIETRDNTEQPNRADANKIQGCDYHPGFQQIAHGRGLQPTTIQNLRMVAFTGVVSVITFRQLCESHPAPVGYEITEEVKE